MWNGRQVFFKCFAAKGFPMRNNVKLAWIISGLALGTSMLFACPVARAETCSELVARK